MDPLRPIERPREASVPREHVVHVVDDDEGVCQAFGRVLDGAGHPFRLHSPFAAFVAAPPAGLGGCIVIVFATRRLRGDAPEVERGLRTARLGLPVIVVAGHADVSLAVAVLKAGVFDFVERSNDTSAFLAAVAAALDWQDRAASRHAAIEAIREHLRLLSNRERAVLDGLLAGRANKTIARDLGVSPRTIEVYRARLMLKMQAGTLSGLVRMALMSAGEARAD